MSHGGRGHLPLRRVRGRADYTREACGAEGRAGGAARTEGLQGGWSQERGAPESQHRGEDAASPGAGRPALPPVGGARWGRGSSSGKSTLHGGAEAGKESKQENAAKGCVYVY